MLLMAAIPALAEETAGTAESYRECLENYEFAAPEFENAVLYEDTTGKPFDLTIRVKSVEEECVLIEVDNRCEGPVNITFSQYMLDDIALYRYNDWIVAARTAREFELDVPKNMLKWAGRQTVGEIRLSSLTITGKGTLRGSYYTDLATARLTDAPAESVWQGEGYVLYDEEWGSLTLLGIDYAEVDPRVFFRMENRLPTWGKEWARGVTFYSAMLVRVEITSVNGMPVDAQAYMNMNWEGAAIDGAYLDELRGTGSAIEEMRMRVSIRASGETTEIEEEREYTVRIQEGGAVILGTPQNN